MPSSIASLLNLQSVAAAQRAALWTRGVRDFFPGLSVRELGGNLNTGAISGMSFGPGRLWSILSPPLLVSYDPAVSPGETQLFSVMMQLQGATEARQRHRHCLLQPGDFCVIDSSAAFELEVSSSSHVMFIQMPRPTVLGRHPYLERHTAEVFDPNETGAMLLRGLLVNILDSAPLLEDYQRSSALGAIIQLLGAPKYPHGDGIGELHWRVRAALAYIDAQFADTTLTASRIAKEQGISRRRLDEIMRQSVGTSLTGEIWNRRLRQAATDLAEPQRNRHSVAQIAFAAGFEDAAHFTRAFKRRFHCTPREWRRRETAAAARDSAARLTPQTCGASHAHPSN
jgi:AraC family transcriptional regulator, positive regulator of tynA and feaB